MKYHTVKKGESLWQIANMHNISLQALIDANPQIEDPNEITVGMKILIPECDDWTIPEPPQNQPDNTPNQPSQPSQPSQPNRPGNGDQVVDGENNDIENEELCRRLAALPRPLIYVVKQGDTLYKISKCFDIGLRELLQVNRHIKNPDMIAAGDKIFIPRSKSVYPMPPHHHHRPNRPNSRPDICPYCGRPMDDN